MNENYVVGIDIGSSNVRVLTGELEESGKIKLIGVSSSPVEGMVKGEILDHGKVNKALEKALKKAEKMAGVRIKGACVSISGAGIRSFDSEGALTRHENGGISREEAKHVTGSARKVPLPADRTVIHMMEQPFVIDEEEGIRDPVGMSGSRLERTVHIVTSVRKQVDMLRDLLECRGIELVDIMFAPFADARAIAGSADIQPEGMVINIGGEVTSFAWYGNGYLKSSGVLPVGGFNISNDLSIGMSLPFEITEQLKKKMCLFDFDSSEEEKTAGREIEIEGRQYRFGIHETDAIAVPRCMELFKLIGEHAGLNADFRGPVLLSGGGSRLEGIYRVAGDVLNVPVEVVNPSNIGGLVELAGDPGWITGVGLLFRGRDVMEGYGEGGRINGYFNRILNGLKKVVC